MMNWVLIQPELTFPYFDLIGKKIKIKIVSIALPDSNGDIISEAGSIFIQVFDIAWIDEV